MLVKKLQMIITTLDSEHNKILGGFTVDYNYPVIPYICYYVIERGDKVIFPGIYIIPQHIDTVCKFQPIKPRGEIKKQRIGYSVSDVLRKGGYKEEDIKYILC